MEKALFRNFVKYVSLNILGMVGISCYILADTFYVSKALGATGIAALNLSISIYSVIHGIGLMIGIGGATRFSILKSRDKEKEANAVFLTSVMFGVLAGLIFVIIGIFGAEYLAMALGADSSTLPLTKTYLGTILSFSPFFILNNVMLAFVRNDDNPRLSMAAMLTGSFSNIILDYVFMFPLGMGMFGAAFATGLAPIISIAILMIHFIKKKGILEFHRSKFSWAPIPDLVGLGLSACINEVSSAVVLITFNLVILKLEGNMGVAAYGIIANLALVGIAVFTGLAQGAQPLVSQFYGRKERMLLGKVRKYTLLSAILIAVIIYLGVLGYGDKIVEIFNSESNPEISRMAITGLLIYFSGFLFAGVNITSAMLSSATENARDAFTISITRGIIIIVPLVLVLSSFLHMTGVWLAFLLTELIVTVIAISLAGVHRRSSGC